jgi:hypothetical protein
MRAASRVRPKYVSNTGRKILPVFTGDTLKDAFWREHDEIGTVIRDVHRRSDASTR